eukprot:SAG31_NODE_49735_length_130_cov_822.129032_1_plen_43_part_11
MHGMHGMVGWTEIKFRIGSRREPREPCHLYSQNAILRPDLSRA